MVGRLWRYFRLDGDPPKYSDPNLFTMRIHHGGRFHSEKGVNKVYRGGQVCYVDGVDPDTMSMTGIHYWAYDLGYQMPPIQFWFRIPGSEEGDGYLPLCTDQEAVEMCHYVCPRLNYMDLYIVCTSERRIFSVEELDQFEENLNHAMFIGWWIEDVEEGPNVTSDDEEEERSLGAEEMGYAEEPIFVDLDELSDEPNGETVAANGNGPDQDVDGHLPQEQDAQVPEQNEDGHGVPEDRGHTPTVDDVEASMTLAEVERANKRRKEKGKDVVQEEDNPPAKKNKGRKRPEVQRRYSTRSGGESSRGHSVPDVDVSSESTTDSEDPDFDGIVDSDYELDSEDDDVQFQQNVDGDRSRVNEFEEMGFGGDISEEGGTESEGLDSMHGSSGEDDEDRGKFPVKCRRRYSSWREFKYKEDMKRPTFELGMEFPNSKVFKSAIRKHAVQTRKEIRFPTNTRHKVLARCKTSPGCPWRIYASTTDLDNPTIYIRTLRQEHKCASFGKKVYHMHAPFIAEEYMDFFMSDPNWSREGMQNAINKDFEMEVDYQMCYRARVKALNLAQGSHADQYDLLESYAHELKKRNPGTSVWIHTELDGELARFKRIYICIEALKKGWKEGCRPYIGLDGCHLKSVHKGQLLSAVGIDGNNGIFPIAWAIVEAETRETWTWFLKFLKIDLDIHHSTHYTFMSDKQKGLEQAIKELFPYAAHRHCVRHLHNNFKSDGHQGLELKNKLWAIARSCTMNQFRDALEDMKKSSTTGWQWCMDRPAQHWSKSHFDPKFKCVVLLNNHCESFNKSILPARKKPILGCLENIRAATMVRLANRRQSGPNWRCNVGPRIEKQMKKNAELSHEYRVISSSNNIFEIQGRGVACASGVVAAHSISLEARTCTCKRWDISGVPCGHAVAAIHSKGLRPDNFVHDYFTKDTYMKAYDPVMFPIAGVVEWDKIHRPIAPPLYRRQPGRPKMSRNKEQGEVPPPPPAEVEKLPRVYYSQVSCGICKKKGHNRRTCKQRNQQGENVVQQQANEGEQQQEDEGVQQQDPQEAEPVQQQHNETQDVEPQVSQNVEESQPTYVPSQQSHTTTASGSSSRLGFTNRRFKLLAHRKPRPATAPPSQENDSE